MTSLHEHIHAWFIWSGYAQYRKTHYGQFSKYKKKNKLKSPSLAIRPTKKS